MSSPQSARRAETNWLRARTTLYINLLESLTLDICSQEALDISTDLTLGRLLIKDRGLAPNTHHKASPTNPQILTRDELISMGLPQQRHLSSTLQKQLLNEVRKTLSEIESFMLAEEESIQTFADFETIPATLQEYQEVLVSLDDDVKAKTQSIKHLITNVDNNRRSLEAEIRKLLETVPVTLAYQSAQGELCSATLENALIRLSLLKAQSERQLYNHTIRGKDSFDTVSASTVSQALEAAYNSLRDQEHDMATEALALDVQLRDYTALLELVDGGKRGAYKQVVDDWTKIKQDTDECLKDLRRLGWTGE